MTESIRGVVVSDVDAALVCIDLAEHLIALHKDTNAYAVRCRSEVMLALKLTCTAIAELYGYSVEVYGRSVYWMVDFLSDKLPNLKPFVMLYNAAHPDCDFAQISIADGDFDTAYELLQTYVDWIKSVIA